MISPDEALPKASSFTPADETKPAFEFILLGQQGRLGKAGVKHVRSHTIRQVYKRKRDELKSYRRLQPGNLRFGSNFDVFQCLPQTTFDQQIPDNARELKLLMYQLHGQRLSPKVWAEFNQAPSFFVACLFLTSTTVDVSRGFNKSRATTLLKSEVIRRVQESLKHSTQRSLMDALAAVACLSSSTVVGERSPWTRNASQTHGRVPPINYPKAPAQNNLNDYIAELVLHLDALMKLSIECIYQIAQGNRNDLILSSMDMSILTFARMTLRAYESLPNAQLDQLEEFDSFLEKATYTGRTPDPALYSPYFREGMEHCIHAFPTAHSIELRQLLQLTVSLFDEWQKHSTSGVSVFNGSITMIMAQIKSLPSVHDTDSPCRGDYIYECCRLTSNILVRAFESTTPIERLSSLELSIEEVHRKLLYTDLDKIWGSEIGLLHWVALVWHHATMNRKYHELFRSLLIRISLLAALQFKDWRCNIYPVRAHNNMVRLFYQQVQQKLN